MNKTLLISLAMWCGVLLVSMGTASAQDGDSCLNRCGVPCADRCLGPCSPCHRGGCSCGRDGNQRLWLMDEGSAGGYWQRSSETLEQITRRHGLRVYKEAGLTYKKSKGIFRRPLRHFALYYESYQARDVRESRRLLVYAVQTYLQMVNEVPHPELEGEPLRSDMLMVHIDFDNFFASYVDRQYVHSVCMRNDRIIYRAYNVCGGEYRMYAEEYWDQAVDIVRAEEEMRANLSRSVRANL